VLGRLIFNPTGFTSATTLSNGSSGMRFIESIGARVIAPPVGTRGDFVQEVGPPSNLRSQLLFGDCRIDDDLNSI
jgi:hypothetical protein